MHTTSTPCCLHDVTFLSLKKPRSDPYSSGTSPKVCLWRSSEITTCCSSTGLPSNTSYCVIKPRALSARNTLWPNSIGVCTLPRLIRSVWGSKIEIELLSSWNLLAVKHTTARLINHSNSKIAKVLDLLAKLSDSQIGDDVFATRFSGPPERRSCAFDDLPGNADQFAICRGLLLLALP